MTDANELVNAIKRVRRGQEGKPLRLLVPAALPSKVVDVLAQLDVKVTVDALLAPDSAFLVDANDRKFWDVRPEYPMHAWMPRRR